MARKKKPKHFAINFGEKTTPLIQLMAFLSMENTTIKLYVLYHSAYHYYIHSRGFEAEVYAVVARFNRYSLNRIDIQDPSGFFFPQKNIGRNGKTISTRIGEKKLMYRVLVNI